MWRDGSLCSARVQGFDEERANYSGVGLIARNAVPTKPKSRLAAEFLA